MKAMCEPFGVTSILATGLLAHPTRRFQRRAGGLAFIVVTYLTAPWR